MEFTYFQGFLFNQNISNKEEAKEYLNTMFNNEPIKKIIFINDYSNIYFKTYTIKDDILTKIYEEAILFENNKKIIVRDNIHIYHFFRYNKKNNNHIELYKLVSNIENMTRLLISFATYLSPNIDHKLFMKERVRGTNIDQYYNKYVIIPKHEKYPVDTAAAMWDRDYFIKKLGDGDYSAWQFEVNMCNEAESESGIDGLILCDERTPINITEIPIVIQGKFYPAGVKFFKKLGYTIDISHRDMMSCNLIIKEILKSKMARFPFFRKQLKYIASRFLGYNFFTKD